MAITEIPYADYADLFIEKESHGGVFLSTCANGKNNTMTIGWGSIGFMWGKPVLTVMIRKSRYSYELIEKNPEFTVSIPIHDDLKKALGICGSKSGRNIDKFKEAELEILAGQKVTPPVIKGAGLHLECKVRYQQTLSADKFSPELCDKWYSDHDWHVLYYGEIVSAYVEK